MKGDPIYDYGSLLAGALGGFTMYRNGCLPDRPYRPGSAPRLSDPPLFSQYPTTVSLPRGSAPPKSWRVGVPPGFGAR